VLPARFLTLLLAIILGAAPAFGQNVAWTRHEPAGPDGSGTLAYDSARGVTVLFGGVSNDQTWEWDGTRWTQRIVAGPHARSGCAMAYDAARGVTVLFGGVYQREDTSYNWLSDTWEWDGTSWTQRMVTGPSGRASAMSYDAARGVTVLFGGSNDPWGCGQCGGILGDTWEWDGASWTQRTSQSAPARRFGHAMVYDSARHVTVLFGGRCSWDCIMAPETWEWDGASWSLTSANGPRGRMGPALAYDAARGVTVLFGGSLDEEYLSDTWEWNGSHWVQRTAQGPTNLGWQSAAYDAARRVTVLFGAVGPDGGFAVSTWEWNGTTWTQPYTAGVPALAHHAMAYDTARGVTVLFSVTYPFGGETWEWNGTTWTERTLTGPGLRVDHAMAYDTRRGVTVLFGGGWGPSLYDDTWEWNGTTWTQGAGPRPPARYCHAMAYDTARGVTVLFGGGSSPAGGAPLADTWEWDGVLWTQRMVTGPALGDCVAMAYDSARGVCVLVGEHPSGAESIPQTWEWDGSSWTQRMVTTPFVSGSRVAYDSARNATVLFGGASGGETWEWNGTVWRPRLIAGPSARSFHAMAYDSARRTTVLFGGGDDLSTWELAFACTADFNNDGDTGTDADIESFFACLAGACCPACPPNTDFNGDGDSGTDADIEAFFRVLAGGSC
jgi:hypothetical protein